MYKFDKQKLRSLESFGVSGVLAEDADVFHDSFFSILHLGRVSDLLSARLKGTGINEFRLRIVLVLGIFQIKHNQLGLEKEPILLECGTDSEKLAIGVCFNFTPDLMFSTENVSERVFKNQPQSIFEEMLVELQNHTDQVILKFDSASRRVEIVLLIGLETGNNDVQSRQPLELVVFDKSKAPEAPQPKSYVNLGDVDYVGLLEQTSISAETSDSLEETRIAGGLKEEETKRVVRGGQKEQSEEVIRIKGQNVALSNEEKVVVSSREIQPENSIWKLTNLSSLVKGTKKTVNNFIGLFKSNPTDEIEIDMAVVSVPPLSPVEVPKETNEIPKEIVKVDEPEISKDPLNVGDPEGVVKKVVLDLWDGGLEKSIARIRDEMPLHKKDFKNEKATEWINGIVSSLAAEKNRLSEVSKKVNLSVRVKDLELRNRITGFQEELKRKDIEIRQKENALARSKEQAAHLMKEMEKLKNAGMGDSEEAQLKLKFSMAQKTLLLSKEENTQLTRRVEDLKKQLGGAQNTSKAQGVPASEHNALREKYVRVFRQAEEFKRANRQLMDHLNDPKKQERSVNVGTAEELKVRLEAAMKLNMASRKEIEEMKSRILLQQKQEANLKGIVSRLQTEITRLMNKKKTDAAKKSDGGSGGAAPPKVA